MKRRRHSEQGVVLVNVLVVLAIAGGLMVLLISAQDDALDRVARAADAAIVEQIAYGAEASVVDALRRDLDEGPETDHLQEPWALAVIQDEVILPTGRFSVNVTDLQAKFDINQLGNATAGTQEFARRLFIALDQPPETANQIIRVLSAIGRIDDLDALAAFGVDPDALASIAPYATALPVDGSINLNAADPFLLAVMLQNPSHASQLVRIREGKGFVTYDDLRGIGALRPQNSGLTSNVFDVDILAQAGDAEIRMRTTLVRRNERGVKAVDILSRSFRYDTPDAD